MIVITFMFGVVVTTLQKYLIYYKAVFRRINLRRDATRNQSSQLVLIEYKVNAKTI